MAITDLEQYLIELFNRARMDPLGEAARFGIDLNEGLEPGTISATPKAALAPNTYLEAAAQDHSEWMLAADVFSHTGEGGSTVEERLLSAGYALSGAWSYGENLAWFGIHLGGVDLLEAAEDHHQGLFLSPYHRENLLYPDFREVGLAQVRGDFTADDGDTYDASMLTVDFARSGDGVFVTGVAYQDLDGDAFYTVGEGRSGIGIHAGLGGVSTAAAGGYALAVSASATTSVEIVVDQVTSEVVVDTSGGNAKLDVVDGDRLLVSVDMTLVSGIADAGLLGVFDANLFGNAGANDLRGNAGENALEGNGGDDLLSGGAGADDLTGGTGRDIFLGAAGAADLIGDRIADFTRLDRIVFNDESDVLDITVLTTETRIAFDTDLDGNSDGALTLSGDFSGAGFFIRRSAGSTEITLASGDRQDFTGDGTDDILWRKDSGRVSFWEMQEGDESYRVIADIDTAWTIRGKGDFTGDGTDDILWRKDAGNVGFWQMQNGDETYHVIGHAGSDWTVTGTGDFNGDAADDVLWRKTTGTVGYWEMHDGNETFHVIGYAGSDWSIEGTGDFNGDGTDDVLWRKDTGTAGYWEMHDGDEAFHVIGYAGTDWLIAGTGDFNGDGTDDVLWRKDTGTVGFWEMDGGSGTFRVIGYATTDWGIEGTGDFTGDGTDDVLWRKDSGRVAYWEMREGDETYHVIADVGPNWDIV
ncbi:MSHA pilin protein MshA [Rhodovulum sp. P5]|uniref:FG-GAP-like repeat-containing protein n=1 Tax=Rhodovulum sp. P5 TaxID=1564506 RepID=UPI0009C25BA6|nr:FG-GAP-like repeat-containing protein [Rhodovulum sp. P5]ARE39199.1 MSHA pilin protein MshA [Rhodovulum sp. P5]